MMGVRAARAHERGGHVAGLFDGQPLRKRDYAFGGYGNSFFIRTRRWALWARNQPSRFHLFDKSRDPGESTNVAHKHPRWCTASTGPSRRGRAASCPTTGAWTRTDNLPRV